jgi:hypothetical protein
MLSSVIATAAVVSINAFAGDRQGNPLDPSYYKGRPATEVNVATTTPYVDSGNPLDPSFRKAPTTPEWVGTAATRAQPYVDSRNPLSPSYKKI